MSEMKCNMAANMYVTLVWWSGSDPTHSFIPLFDEPLITVSIYFLFCDITVLTVFLTHNKFLNCSPVSVQFNLNFWCPNEIFIILWRENKNVLVA